MAAPSEVQQNPANGTPARTENTAVARTPEGAASYPPPALAKEHMELFTHLVCIEEPAAFWVTSFEHFTQQRFGVGIMGPVAYFLAEHLKHNEKGKEQYPLVQMKVLKMMAAMLDGVGAATFAAALRMHASPAIASARHDLNDPDLDTEMKAISDLAFRVLLRAEGHRSRHYFAYNEQRRIVLVSADIVEWEWREMGGHGVDLSVWFSPPNSKPGEETQLQSKVRLRAGGGRYTAAKDGELVFEFSNEFSWTLNKDVAFSYRILNNSKGENSAA